MIKVILRNGWYGPDGVFYRKSATRKGPPVDIPDDVVLDAEGRSRLPSTAVVVSDDYVTPMPVRSADTLSEHRKMIDQTDPARAAAAAERAAAEAAGQALDAQRVKNAEKFRKDLAAEEAAKPAKKGKG